MSTTWIWLFCLVDNTSHLNELNLKLRGQDNSVADLMTAVRSFQGKPDIFKEDLQGECTHYCLDEVCVEVHIVTDIFHIVNYL